MYVATYIRQHISVYEHIINWYTTIRVMVTLSPENSAVLISKLGALINDKFEDRAGIGKGGWRPPTGESFCNCFDNQQ